MIYLLDTNTVSSIVKGHSRRARRKLARVSEDHDVCISVMTEAEVRFGLARGKLSAATEAAVELFLSKIDLLAWDSAAARADAKARATLERIGKLLANMDLLTAAHAAAVGAVLVTTDHTLEECSKQIDVRQTVNWAGDVRGETPTPHLLIVYVARWGRGRKRRFRPSVKLREDSRFRRRGRSRCRETLSAPAGPYLR